MKIHLLFILLLANLLNAFSQGSTDNNRPNIVFIMSDDHTTQAISAYSNKLMDTPNIDRIAKDGAIFKNFFATNALCAPSRAVLLTGKHSHLNKMTTNRENMVFDGSQETFPKLLQRAGYNTAMIGKWHLVSDPTGFNYWDILPGQGNYYNPDFINPEGKYREDGYVTNIITEKSLEWLRTAKDKPQPFMMMVHHKAPHGTWLPDLKYLDYLEDKDFDFPENFFDNYEGRGAAAKEQEMEIANDMQWGKQTKFEFDPYTGEETNFKSLINRMTDEQKEAWRAVYTPLNEAFAQNPPEGKELAKFKYLRYLRDYLKCIKSVDDGVGEILNYLDESGLAENTIVIYTSDQGFFLGEHGWWDKRFMYEESIKTPLLLKYPTHIKPRTVVDELTMNLDLAPTLLDFAGVSIPQEMQGKSLKTISKGKKSPWRDVVYYHFYEYPGPQMVKRHYGIRTDRYKLIHFYYDIDEWELYDLKKDPKEMKSVYNDPDYAQVRKKLQEKVKKVKNGYGDFASIKIDEE